MRKTAMITVGLLLGASLLGACGSDNKDKGSAASSSDYCESLKSAKDDITKFTGNNIPSAKDFDSFLKEVDTLTGEAPSAVSDDWKKLQTALTSLTDALDKYGVTLDEVSEAASTGKLPDGVTLADFQKLGTELQGLGNSDFDAAAKAIDAHAKDKCGIKISIS